MSRINNQDTPLSLDSQIDEDKVRRALGLKTSGNTIHQQRPEQARQRHRFVTDGSVPVVMLNRHDSETTGLKERLATLETALESERAAHHSTRRALTDLQQAYQALQTRFSHTELSNGEVLKSERDARRAAEAMIATLREELQAAPKRRVVREVAAPVELRDEAPVEAHVEVFAEPIVEPVSDNAAVSVSDKAPAPIVVRAARKPRAPAAPKEQKPVRWWTPSFRAKKNP